MITYKKGNLLNTPDKIIAHGCNALGVMGSGVALAIKTKYPRAFEIYYSFYKMHSQNIDDHLMGYCFAAPQNDGKVILNCITQKYAGHDGQRYVSYDAMDSCMGHIAEYLETMQPGINAVSMPKIGAGLGGGNWEVIEAIINHRLKDVNVTVWEL